MYINGKWVSSSNNQVFDVINPANQQVIAKVPKGDVNDARLAIDSARNAFDSGVWSNKSPGERANYLWKLADLVEKEAANLAKLESMQTGKSIKYARDSDMPFIIDNLRFFASAARCLEGKSAGEYLTYSDSKGNPQPLGTSMIRREPIGVCAAVVPWNYPLFIAVWKLAPALAAGNTIVIKPATNTPLTLLEFAKLVEKAGIPAGVFNVVTGPGDIIGHELATNPKVDMISLTGDTTTGKKVMQQASGSLKKIHLELGGKAPLIALPDADIDAVAQGATIGAYWNTGQDCTAVTRVYVHEKNFAELVKKMVSVTKLFKVGDPSKEDTDLGPMISQKQLERVVFYIQMAKKEGAKIEIGGNVSKKAGYPKGFYFEPTVLTGVKHESRVCQEEIFGPVVLVFRYSNLDEAIEKANDVSYGLAASVWGCNITKCMEVARKLNFGTVWINEHGALASEMPHGGFKQSGFGKDSSMYSLEEYTRIKHVYIDQTGMARKPWHSVVLGKEPKLK